MMTLAQAGGGTDLAQVLGIGGPVATIAFVVGFFINAYRQKRKDDLEEKDSERKSESGIVETTGSLLGIVQGQMETFKKDLAAEVKKREELKDEHAKEIAELRRRISELETENTRLRQGAM